METYRSYEHEVKQALTKWLREHFTSSVIEVFGSRKYTGKEGAEHEIDVSATVVTDFKLFIIVECKCFNSRVSKNYVESFAHRKEDLGANVALMFTTIGFQSGAMQVAKANGIKLIVQPRSDPEGPWNVVLPAGLAAIIAADALSSAVHASTGTTSEIAPVNPANYLPQSIGPHRHSTPLVGGFGTAAITRDLESGDRPAQEVKHESRPRIRRRSRQDCASDRTAVREPSQRARLLAIDNAFERVVEIMRRLMIAQLKGRRRRSTFGRGDDDPTIRMLQESLLDEWQNISFALCDPDTVTAARALDALYRLAGLLHKDGPIRGANIVVDHLLSDARGHAYVFLHRMLSCISETVTALVNVLADHDTHTETRAAETLILLCRSIWLSRQRRLLPLFHRFVLPGADLGESTYSVLSDLVVSDNHSVVVACRGVLCCCTDPQAVRPLLQFCTERDETVVLGVARALERIDWPQDRYQHQQICHDAGIALARNLEPSANRSCLAKAACVDAIREGKYRSGMPWLLPLLVENEEITRPVHIRLNGAGSVIEDKRLDAGLRDYDGTLAEYAAIALAELDDASGANVLIARLEERETRDYDIVRAVSRIRAQGAIPALARKAGVAKTQFERDRYLEAIEQIDKAEASRLRTSLPPVTASDPGVTQTPPATPKQQTLLQFLAASFGLILNRATPPTQARVSRRRLLMPWHRSDNFEP